MEGRRLLAALEVVTQALLANNESKDEMSLDQYQYLCETFTQAYSTGLLEHKDASIAAANLIRMALKVCHLPASQAGKRTRTKSVRAAKKAYRVGLRLLKEEEATNSVTETST